VPTKLIEARLGRTKVRQEAISEMVPDFVDEAIKKDGLEVIASPEVEVVEGEESGPVKVKAIVEVYPEVNIAGYEGLEVRITGLEPTEEEIQSRIDKLRATAGELVDQDRSIKKGDRVTVTIENREDPSDAQVMLEDYVLEVGANELVETLDQALVGVSKGDEVTFAWKTRESEEPKELVAKVGEVRELILPEITDEWAQDASEFSTVDELKADIVEKLKESKLNYAQREFRAKSVMALSELMDVEPPRSLVELEVRKDVDNLLHRLEHSSISFSQYLELTGQSEESILANTFVECSIRVKGSMALRALATKLEVDVSDEELREEIKKSAEADNRGNIPDLEDLWSLLDREGRLKGLRSDMREVKALQWLLENIEVKDEQGNQVDKSNLIDDNENASSPSSGEGE
ncbi:MAG: trigger factor, partial [Acidimicrobiales bacterium]|nr:trigger factor [Acidimicrobiales bacterium]